MDIVIVAQYLRNIEDFEGNNSRFLYLANKLKEDNSNRIEIITSDFNHGEKRHFKSVGKLDNVKVTVCHEKGYSKNICLKRFASHKELAKNIKLYLRKREVPNLIYVAVPSLDVADVCASYCKRNKVKFVIDIQDLWPEAFKMVFNVPIISNLFFSPFQRLANDIYRTADKIIGVSDTYVKRAVSVNKKCIQGTTVYLGTERKMFDEYAKKGTKKENIIKIVYIGTLGNSYDLNTVIDAIALIEEGTRLEFIIMGDGPLKEKFEKHAQEKGVNTFFYGTIPYKKMVSLLTECDIAVNPIRKGSAGSVINKVGDYAMAGLPVINTQECQEYRNLLIEYNAGINCNCEDAKSVSVALKRLIKDEKLRNQMSRGSRKLGLEKFDRGMTYQLIVDELELFKES